MTRILRPRQPAPKLSLPLVGGGLFTLADEPVDQFLILEIYRGRHCPRCHRHLLDLESKLPHFARRGIRAVAVSMDPRARAEDAKAAFGLNSLQVAYDMTLADADAWDLFVSRSINEREKSLYFTEPATFLIAPDKTIYSAIYNTTPFNRFYFTDMLEALDTISARNYPPRGDVDPRSVHEETPVRVPAN